MPTVYSLVGAALICGSALVVSFVEHASETLAWFLVWLKKGWIATEAAGYNLYETVCRLGASRPDAEREDVSFLHAQN